MLPTPRVDPPRIRAISLGRGCVRQLPSVSWLPWMITGCTSRQSKWQEKSGLDSQRSHSPLPDKSFWKFTDIHVSSQSGSQSIQDAHPGRNRDILSHREQKLNRLTGMSLDFRRWLQGQETFVTGLSRTAHRPLLPLPSLHPCGGPLPHSPSPTSAGAGCRAQHPQPDSRNGILGPVNTNSNQITIKMGETLA